VVVSTYFVKRLAEIGRPDLQGWVFAGVGGGTALVGLAILGLMLTTAPSRMAWQIFGLATLAVTACIFFVLGRRSIVHATTGPSRDGPNDDTSTALAWHLILPYGAVGAGYIIPATYLPIMGQQAVSSPLIFGWAWPVFGLAAAVSTLITARLHATCSDRQIWISSQLVMALGLLLPALWPHIAFVVIGGICVGGTFMVITMAGLKEAHRLAGSANPQYHIAAMTTAFALGQIIGPFLAGWTYDATASFTWPLLLASAILVLTLVPMFTHSTPVEQRP
ncbi:MAG: YbfB/YjiJ family MFS transporter, partial [Geminicoccaceae bacterium]